MRYLSLFSGIEAASVAWHPLGWTPVAFAEIEPFPAAVLKERFPGVPNFGDVSKFKEWNINGPIDLIVGGSPCQSFSVAGLRKGLDDPRGNLALTYLAIVEKYQPKWFVWENVPGVLSSNGGRDFGSFLGAVEKLGYGFAYRVLDAQYVRTPGFPHAVPQRRRRVFVVGCLGDAGRAAAVLFDGESLSGNPPPRRKKRKRVAGFTASSFGGNESVATAFKIRGGSETETGEYGGTVGRKAGKGYLGSDELAFTVAAVQDQNICYPINTMAVQGRPSDNGKMTFGIGNESDPLPTLSKAHNHAVAFKPGSIAGNAGLAGKSDISPTLRSEMGDNQPTMRAGMQVRRLIPVECERLQGFPDDWTRIPWRKKEAQDCPDGPRYKAIGNSMAVNVMQWLGMRIAMVEDITDEIS